MQIIILASDVQRQELLSSAQPDAALLWVHQVPELASHPNAKLVVDLLFTPDAQRIQSLQALNKPVVVNAVTHTLQELSITATRINAWPGFLQGEWIEAATNDEATKPVVEQAFALFGKRVQWLSDDPGFVSARVISMIINEAYLALEEGVSTKEEINTAMKLGTAYPFGPFEWAEKIGVENVMALLKKLGATKAHYLPAKTMQ